MINADRCAQLEERIRKQMLLKPALKEELVKILQHIEEDDDAKRIETILEKAEQKEQEMLEKMAKYDEMFTTKLKQFITNEYLQQQKISEETLRKEEQPEALLEQL